MAAGLVKRKISAPASEPSYLNKLETKSDTPLYFRMNLRFITEQQNVTKSKLSLQRQTAKR